MKSINNLGIAPVVAALIVSLVVEGINYGLSAYAAAQQAKEQAKIQRELQEDEIGYIANQLSMQTDIPFAQWYTVVKMTFNMPIITPPEEPPTEPTGNKTIVYIAIGIIAILAITRS